MKKNQETNEQTAMRVSSVSIVINVVLSLLKLLAGILASSGAMISDAVHSASDVFSTIIVMIGISISGRDSDKEHPYGHDRLECVASIVLSMLLAFTGIGIGRAGLDKIMGGSYEKLAIPGIPALAAAILSIAVKEWMYWYTRSAALKTNSGALMADAWHHRSDALSSVGALVGIAGARMGYPVADPVASLVICIFIEKAAYDIFVDALEKMVDHACPDETVQAMQDIILAQPGVEGVDDIKTRLFGAKIYVDVEIAVNGSIPLREAHEIAQKVHDAIEREVPGVKHCMVHENPSLNRTITAESQTVQS